MVGRSLGTLEADKHGFTVFDPEDIQIEHDDSESEDDDEPSYDRRSHYASSQRSGIRSAQPNSLPAQYSGAVVSRDLITRDESHNSMKEGASVEDNPQSSDLSGASSDELDKDSKRAEQFDHANARTNQESNADRTALLAATRRARSNAVQDLKATAQADVAKGVAVKQQRKAFNALLDLRMRLQKGLVAANGVNAISEMEIKSSEDRIAVEAAEKAALQLLDNISDLRWSTQPRSEQSRGTKRSFSMTAEPSIGTIFAGIASTENDMSQLRLVNLDRWSKRTNPTSLKIRSDTLRTESNQQSLPDMLDAQFDISSMTRLVARTRIARSCAPPRTASNERDNVSIYDDADWYSQLLRELVEGKLADPDASNPGAKSHLANLNGMRLLQIQRDAKTHRLNVDVKASKGRKLRFAVQEKIQNFMAPDDRTTWAEMQMKDLFGSLIGRRQMGQVRNTDTEDSLQNGIDADKEHVEALPLFKKNDKDMIY